MSKPICIVTETDWVPEDALEKLRATFDLELGPFSTESLKNVIPGAHGMLVGLDHKLESDMLSGKLQFIASPTTGLNHIDLEMAEKNQVEIISLKGETDFLEGITATSELCWGLLLALTRKIPQAASSVNAGQWDRDLFISNELKEATLGIIGLGRLGRKVASYAMAFDMRVVACDIRDVEMQGIEVQSLENVLSQSDIICLHADSRPDNYHMISTEEFSQMKDGAYFINTARGDLVDEGALLACLKSGKLAGAALDVLQMEHQENSASSQELLNYAKAHDNLIITPHIGGVSYESQYKTTHFTIDKLLKWWNETQQG